MSVLGLDVGLVPMKAAIFGEDGNIQGYTSRECGYTPPHRSWAEQNPNEVWQAVCSVLC